MLTESLSFLSFFATSVYHERKKVSKSSVESQNSFCVQWIPGLSPEQDSSHRTGPLAMVVPIAGFDPGEIEIL